MDKSKNSNKPHHIAIIMDGNGRWANNKGLPRAAGHKAGIKTLRKIVEYCRSEEIQVLTVYAFSSENWRRPVQEVGLLMELFITALEEQVAELHTNGVNIQFIGDLSRFPEKLQDSIAAAESLTENNISLNLRMAANYGGRWDITNAFKSLLSRIDRNEIDIGDVDEAMIQQSLSLAELPEPDLFIRTGGEQRISNFLLWQLAYTELYFTDIYWPDFSPEKLAEACEWYEKRQRRFGQTSEQLKQARHA
ncbi:MAG: undecaprenyl diphosphate synthase [Gammaproteobacteria bacterium]|jgi:undecaprenyl diphosphate synthase